jgi:hypothetical protein
MCLKSGGVPLIYLNTPLSRPEPPGYVLVPPQDLGHNPQDRKEHVWILTAEIGLVQREIPNVIFAQYVFL